MEKERQKKGTQKTRRSIKFIRRLGIGVGILFFLGLTLRIAAVESACGVFGEGWFQFFYQKNPIHLYAKINGACQQIAPTSQQEQYYSDEYCHTPIAYEPTSFYDYCKQDLLGWNAPANLGDPQAWVRKPESIPLMQKYNHLKWTNSFGTSANIHILSEKKIPMSFLKQIEYRRVSIHQKKQTCSLEMRVYKEKIGDQNLKPLLFLHGGGWTYRGFAMAGMEVIFPHLLKQGYVIFAPTTRLVLNNDGPESCQNANGDQIHSDINAALDWVLENGSSFGAIPNSKITVAGHSAGGHSSLHLSFYRKQEIEKSLLLYPATDFEYFLTYTTANMETVPELGKKVVPPFIHELNKEGKLLEIQEMNPKHPNVIKNSFPQLIAQESRRERHSLPPIFLIQGKGDRLVHFAHATRLCEALQGESNFSVPNSEGHEIFTCGENRGISNRLYLIAGADHILDAQCMGFEFNGEFVPVFCPSGSQRASKQVLTAFEEALQWINQ